MHLLAASVNYPILDGGDFFLKISKLKKVRVVRVTLQCLLHRHLRRLDGGDDDDGAQH